MPHTPEERAKLDRIGELIRRPRGNNLSRYLWDEEFAMQLERRKPPRRPLGRRLQDGLLTVLAWVIVAGALLGAILWLSLDRLWNPPKSG